MVHVAEHLAALPKSWAQSFPQFGGGDTVGAFLVICLVVTPGATAWLLTDRFPRLLAIAVAIGSLTSFFGAWLSYYLDGATGGIIVVAQTLLFLAAFVFAPKHGLLASRRRAREASC